MLDPNETDAAYRARRASEEDQETRLMLAKRRTGPHYAHLTHSGSRVWVACHRCGLASDALPSVATAQAMYATWHGGAK